MKHTVLVTGSSRGIGAGIAQRFAEDGHRVAIHYRERETEARALFDALTAAGYSGQGVMLAPYFGKLLGEAVKGQLGEFDLLERLPVPAFPGGPLMRWPLLVAGLSYYALRDRL